MGAQSARLKPTDMQDLLIQTSFSPDEIKELYKGFIKDHPNSYISKDELRSIYGAIFPKGDATVFSEHAFRSFDQNGDGSIDFREFLCALSVTSKGSVDEKLKWAFSLYDLDKNGFISKREMREIITAIYNMIDNVDRNARPHSTPARATDVIFEKMDKNLDGNLSIEEFIDGAKSDPSLVRFLRFEMDALEPLPLDKISAKK